MKLRRDIKGMLIGAGLFRPSLIAARNTVYVAKRREHLANVRFFSQFVRRDDLCFDCGCNVGHMSEALLDVGARVVAVDPQADCIREAQARVGRNKRIEFVPKAVGSSPGTAELFVAPSSVVSSLKADWYEEHTATITVPVTTLDSLIAQFGTPHYVKIDVEGFEIEVLNGLTSKIDCISFEFHTGHRLESIDRVLACLERIRLLQGGSVANVNVNDQPELLFPDWIELDAFIHVFKKDIWHRPRGFGDIVMLSQDFARSLGTRREIR